MLADLLRPPPHRGPLIAAGAVVLTTGLALAELRLGSDEVAPIVRLLVVGAIAALTFGLGLQAPNEDGRPPAYQSVLLVTGLLLVYAALLHLADVLGADLDEDLPAGAFVWTGVLETGAALFAGLRRRSAICLFVAAVAATVTVLSAWQWVFDNDSFTAFRWLLLVIALGLGLLSLVLRARAPRQAELLVDAGGLAILTIGLQALGSYVVRSLNLFAAPSGPLLPGWWEFIVVAAGCGLVAYGAIERSPGPAWIGVANLAVFVIAAGSLSDDTLYWWPLLLILIGAVAMGAGLRPRQPLPPEPDAYRAGDAPLASRSEDDEVVLRVRDDSPPV